MKIQSQHTFPPKQLQWIFNIIQSAAIKGTCRMWTFGWNFQERRKWDGANSKKEQQQDLESCWTHTCILRDVVLPRFLLSDKTKRKSVCGPCACLLARVSVCCSERVCGRRQSGGGSCTGAADRMVLEVQAEAGCCPLTDSSGLTLRSFASVKDRSWNTGKSREYRTERAVIAAEVTNGQQRLHWPVEISGRRQQLGSDWKPSRKIKDGSLGLLNRERCDKDYDMPANQFNNGTYHAYFYATAQ